MEFTRINKRSILLLIISLFIAIVDVGLLTIKSSEGTFSPDLETLIEYVIQKEDPNFCAKTTNPSYCLSKFFASEDFKTSCGKVNDRNLRILCDVMANESPDRNKCEEILNPTFKEECIVELASKLKDIRICDDLVLPTDPEGKVLTAEDVIRRECLTRIGREEKSTKPCDLVEEAYRDFCIDEVNRGPR